MVLSIYSATRYFNLELIDVFKKHLKIDFIFEIHKN